MNPRAAINDLHPFQGCPFSLLGTSPRLNTISYCEALLLQRRGWDSNPRALADKRFSRPPRYDLFDTSPYLIATNCFSSAANVILAKIICSVNNFFQKIFLYFFRSKKHRFLGVFTSFLISVQPKAYLPASLFLYYHNFLQQCIPKHLHRTPLPLHHL